MYIENVEKIDRKTDFLETKPMIFFFLIPIVL